MTEVRKSVATAK